MTNVTTLCLSREQRAARINTSKALREILKSVKHSQCLKGSIRDFVNQSSQHKCYCGESDVTWVLCGHNNNTSHRRPVSRWRLGPRGADNGLGLFSDILLFSNQEGVRFSTLLHTSPSRPPPTQIDHLFVCVCFNKSDTGAGNVISLEISFEH